MVRNGAPVRIHQRRGVRLRQPESQKVAEKLDEEDEQSLWLLRKLVLSRSQRPGLTTFLIQQTPLTLPQESKIPHTGIATLRWKLKTYSIHTFTDTKPQRGILHVITNRTSPTTSCGTEGCS